MSTEIRILEPSDARDFEAFVRERLESSMFLLSNARRAGLVDRGERFQGTYAGAFDAGELVAVAAHYWNGIVIVQAPVHLEDVVRAAVDASGRDVEGTIGLADQAARVVSLLDLPTGDDGGVQLDSREGLFRLRLDALRVPPAITSGDVRVRRLADEDVGVVSDWWRAYRVETLGMDDDGALLADSREHMRRDVGGDTWVAHAPEGPRAMSRFNARVTEAVQVGGVYTPPPWRARGYARCAVAGSLLEARDEGVEQAILFTAEDNPAARKCYESLGFRRIDDWRLLVLEGPGVAAYARGR